MNQESKKRVRLAILAGVAVLMVLAVVVTFRGSRPSVANDSPEVATPSQEEKVSRAAKVARAVRLVKTLRARWTLEPPAVEALVKYKKLLAAPVPIKERMMAGSWEWSPTVLKVEDLAWVAPKRRECGRALGEEIKVMCNYSIDMAIERTGETTGKIKYTKARMDDESPEPLCDALADCIASARLDEQVPLPKGAEDSYGITQSLQSTPIPDHMKDLVSMARVIEEMRSEIADLQETLDPTDLKQVHKYQGDVQFLRYTEGRVKEMQTAPPP